MALTTTVSLTGDDLTLADVWAVAVDGSEALLDEEGRRRLTAARSLVERAASAVSGEHTYGINTGFGRFVSKTIPPELASELQLRLLRSHACGVGEPYPREVVQGRDAPAREHPREGLLRRARRDRRAPPRLPQPRRRAGGSEPGLGRRFGRPRPARPSRASPRRRGTATVDGEELPGAEALARVGLEPVRLEAKEGLSLINGTQFMAAAGALALVRARPACEDRRHRLRPLARGAAGLEDELPAADPRAAAAPGPAARRPRTCSACSKGRPSSRPTAGATRSRTPTRSGAPRRCTAPAATCSRTPRRRSRSSSTRPPTTRSSSSSSDELVSNGNFHGQPLAFALDAVGDGARRARVHLRAARRAADEPVALGRPAGLPHARRGPQLRVHDPAVRGRRPRQREQGAVPSRRGRLDPDERRPGRPRLDGQRLGPQVPPGAGERRARARDRAARRARRRSSSSPRWSPASGARAAHAFVRSLSPAVIEDRPLAGDIEAVAAAIRSGELVAAVERDVEALA